MISMDTENNSSPSAGIYNSSFKWLLAILWLISLVGVAFFFLVQNKSPGMFVSSLSSSPSMSPATSNRLQPVAPNATTQVSSGLESGVYTYVCHDLKIAPSRMQFDCQEGETFIDDIIWFDWKATGATGKGTLNLSDCSFSCKSPNYRMYPVTVKLSSPVKDGKMVYFRRFDYLYVSASGREYPGFWNPTAVHEGRVVSGGR
jgi:hypothetical protein